MTLTMMSRHVINLISTFGAIDKLCSVLLVASRQAMQTTLISQAGEVKIRTVQWQFGP